MKRHVMGFVLILIVGLLGCGGNEEAGPDAKGAAVELRERLTDLFC